MKWLLTSLFIAAIGLETIEAKSVGSSEEIPVSSFFDKIDILGDVEDAIIHECKTEDPTLEVDFKEILEETEECFSSKNYTFIKSNFDNCTSKLVIKTKSCMPAEKKYFVDLLSDYAKGIVEIVHEHSDILRSSTMAKCIDILEESERTIKTCMEQYEREEIPGSKEEACKEFVPIHKCVTDPVKSSCDPKLSKFADDFLEIATSICKA